MKYKKTLLVILSAFLILFLLFLCIPVPKFDKPYSTIVYSSDGRLLSAKISYDGQWRFPPSNILPDKYVRCLTQYEDKWFFYHWGINPVSIVSSAIDNIQSKEIVRGGSTITMQVVRLSRDGKERTFKEKIIESILALRLELKYSKTEILQLYAANAPFGGNVVGIDAAAWRYFNTSVDRLSWSELALLSVLPNSPALIHPGKNRHTLQIKRDKLLVNLVDSKSHLPKRYRDVRNFSEEDYELACMENIPEKPYNLPSLAFHYSSTFAKSFNQKNNISDINYDLQTDLVGIISKHYKNNSANGIENSCIYVVDYIDEKIVAYVGNYLNAKEAGMVDMIMAQRSTGSILKPFLYACMLDDGELLPQTVIPDIPINISGYTPKNYSGEFLGAVTADEALFRSLNMPFVYLLRNYGVNKFYDKLKSCKLSGLKFSPDHYGLSLILGGAEANLYDVTNAYASMAKSLLGEGRREQGEGILFEVPFSPAAISLTFQALLNVTRPEQQVGWQNFQSGKKVAWKTGTSFGLRDAWCVGIVDRYAIGVWVGNADGEGRSGLTGVSVAAPIMFEVVDKLNKRYTFPLITSDAVEVEVCAVSGYPKSQFCKETKIITVPDSEINIGVCPYHKKEFLDSTKQYRIKADCSDLDPNNFEIYYVLPPVMEWFYKKTHADYITMPPLMPGCNFNNEQIMSFVYPDQNATIIIPTGIQGDKQQVVFEIAHRQANTTIFWNLNDYYLGKTKHFHQMPIVTTPGEYLMRCSDEYGNVITRKFKVIAHR
ncbi:penicillin-binding protein 1C [Bacteroidales bacterium OttesenSCG-928-K22]|nr:penicillin-binding protein 1C [Bacteroidales bacterium OttesenSCG-928-K22]